jgi:hypothetical protein
LVPGTVAVLLTSERTLLEMVLGKEGGFYNERLLPVWVLGKKAFLFKLRAA